MSFTVNKDIEGNLNYVQAAGKILSINEVEELDSTLYEIIDSSEIVPKIIFDMAGLTHCNSTGLNHFIRYFTKSRNKGGELVMINIEPGVQKLFKITKLIDVFTIAETKEDAVQILNDL